MLTLRSSASSITGLFLCWPGISMLIHLSSNILGNLPSLLLFNASHLPHFSSPNLIIHFTTSFLCVIPFVNLCIMIITVCCHTFESGKKFPSVIAFVLAFCSHNVKFYFIYVVVWQLSIQKVIGIFFPTIAPHF